MSTGTLPALLAERASAAPDRPFLLFGEEAIELADAARRVRRIARGFADAGVSPGDRVAIILPNRPKNVLAMLGAMAAGCVFVPVNPRYKSSELAAILADSGARALVAARTSCAGLDEFRPGLPDLRAVWCVDGEVEGTMPFDALLSAADDPPPGPGPEDDAGIIYTSGTQGKPRGAVLTHTGYLHNARAFAEAVGLSATDRAVCVLPLFHVFAQVGSIFAPLAAGASVLLMRGFSPRSFLDAMEQHRPTVLVAVPTVYAILSGLPQEIFASLAPLRLCLSGGAPLAEPVVRAFESKAGQVIREGYGLTEATCAVTIQRPAAPLKPGSVGSPLSGQEVRIVDDAFADVPPGSVGEIITRGPHVMRGYHRRDLETSETIRDGWLHTGDLGHIDQDGDLFIDGRKKNLIIRGGENIFPVEVERAVLSDERVDEAAVCGLPDELWGEQVMAFVVPRAGASLEPNEVIDRCKERMADFKCPGRVQLVDALPRTAGGAVNKRELVEEYLRRVGG